MNFHVFVLLRSFATNDICSCHKYLCFQQACLSLLVGLVLDLRLSLRHFLRAVPALSSSGSHDSCSILCSSAACRPERSQLGPALSPTLLPSWKPQSSIQWSVSTAPTHQHGIRMVFRSPDIYTIVLSPSGRLANTLIQNRIEGFLRPKWYAAFKVKQENPKLSHFKINIKWLRAAPQTPTDLGTTTT